MRRWLFAVLLFWACAPGKPSANYVRSPSLDYGREPPRTSDDRVVGADSMDIQDKFGQGPKVGKDSQLAPGWQIADGGVSHDPAERAAGRGATPQQEHQQQP